MSRTNVRCAIARWNYERTEGANLGAHIAACPSCKKYSQSRKSLESALRQQRQLAPRPVEGRASRRRSWPMLGGALAMAAAMLLLVQMRGATDPEAGQAPGRAMEQHGAAEAEAQPPGASATGPTEGLRASAEQLIARVRSIGTESRPLERELEAWRVDGMGGLRSIRSLGVTR